MKKRRKSKYDRQCHACKKVIKRCLAEGGEGDSFAEGPEGVYYHFSCRYSKESDEE